MSKAYVEFSTSFYCQEKQLRYWACILSVVSITFHIVIPLLDAVTIRLPSLQNSRQKVSWSLSTFWLLLRRQLSSWWEIPSLPSMIFVISTTSLTSFHRELVHVMDATCYPACIMFYLEVLLSFMSRMLWALLHLLEILGIVILLTITILSWSPCWF
jgi:hypothetical protein